MFLRIAAVLLVSVLTVSWSSTACPAPPEAGTFSINPSVATAGTQVTANNTVTPYIVFLQKGGQVYRLSSTLMGPITGTIAASVPADTYECFAIYLDGNSARISNTATLTVQ